MILGLLLVCFGLACGGECESVPSYEDWTQGFLKSKCQSCHSTQTLYRYNAPENIFFDDYEDALEHIEAIRSSVLERETMPPGGGLSEDEKILLEQWLECPH